MKSCIICHVKFKPFSNRALCCSPECRKKHKAEHNRKNNPRRVRSYVPKPATVNICENCGIEFTPASKNHPGQRFCSKECNFKSYSRTDEYSRNKKQYKRREAKEGVVVQLRPCLFCGVLRESTWAGDRYHANCRETVGRRSSAMNE